MAVPEWLEAAPGAAAESRAVPEAPPVLAAVLAAVPGQGGCSSLLDVANAVLEHCAGFFVPVELAQLDAALAHCLADRARDRADDANAELAKGIRSGRSAESLAELAHFTSSAKSSAAKAQAQAQLATDVVAALDGTVTASGYDPVAVEKTSAASLIEVIGKLEEAKNAMSAVQAQAQALFMARQRLEQASDGMPMEKIGQGIAMQVGLARHESPHRGRQLCEFSHVLVRELPHTMNAMTAGQIGEYRAGIIARETVFLSLADRARIDELMAADGNALARLGNRELAAASRKAAYALDPHVFVQRHEMAVSDRHVSLRPAADGMTFLTALIPLTQGVRILNTLTKAAKSAKAAGDQRGKGQLMADSLIHRLTQHAPCDAGAGGIGDHQGILLGNAAALPGALCSTPSDADITLELVMTDRSLFGGAEDPAILVGHDPIPSPLARLMVLGDGDGAGYGSTSGGEFSPRVWLKRLFTHPESNALLAMDSKARLFPAGMKEFLRLQDQRCQTPYCDAPIREYDHIKAYAAGGTTTTGNGQGLCTACNQAKEAPGWASIRLAGRPGSLPRTQLTTPTGHRYISTAPPLPGPASRRTRRRC